MLPPQLQLALARLTRNLSDCSSLSVDLASEDWRAEAAHNETVEDLLDLVLARIAFVLIESDTSLSIRTSRLKCSSQSL